jgi:DNA invertase Pin-like site-specific DNA recombinase
MGKNMNIGYVRCSTTDQNTDLQEKALLTAGCERLFVERGSGADKRRPELAAALRLVTRGDTLVVWKLDRLARSMGHLVEIMETLERRGCNFVSVTEAINTKTPGGRLVFGIFAAIAEFERELIRERVTAGVRASIARRGKPHGKPPILEGVDLDKACAGLSVRQAAENLGVCYVTLYRARKRQATEVSRETAPT